MEMLMTELIIIQIVIHITLLMIKEKQLSLVALLDKK